ncbi:MAG: AAA domain-containing protein [Clostridiaceae bacterium]|nr:AAA domain-containing protein [Clostridiaceae bacterium]
MSETYLRSAFKNWITAAEKSGLEPIASPRIDAYVNALKFSTTKIIGAKLPTTDLFLYVTIEEFQSARKIIEHSQNFAFVNETSDGVFGEALDLYSRFLEDITKPVCWIFSSNPKVYDIIPAVQELSIITWRVEQRDKMIKKNDRVYLWLPGVDGGIVASGTIISSPEERDPLRGDPYVVDENLFFEAFLGVDIKIDRRFTNPIISANMLLKNEITKTLEILVFPGSYHYYVMPEQEAAIECVIENCPEPEHFDSVDMTSDEMTDTEAPIDLNTDSAEMTPSDSVTSSSQVFRKRRFWVFTPDDGTKMWADYYTQGFISFGYDSIGDYKKYGSREQIRVKMRSIYGPGRSYKHMGHMAWQFSEEMQPGDIIYMSPDGKKIIGRGIIKSNYYVDVSRKQKKNTRDVIWTDKGDWTISYDLPRFSILNISNYASLCRNIEQDILGSQESIIHNDVSIPGLPKYSPTDFCNDVFMNIDQFNELQQLLKTKKNIILTGAPGVGKTYSAERLAYAIMGKKDPDRLKTIQFHKSYSYDSFVMGYLNSEAGKVLQTGIFYDLCKEAEPDDRDYFLIIDDIGRGDVSAIFGDLLNLIGPDYREKSIRLLYRDEYFSVPKNLYIIATLSTTRESSPFSDYSLRRRFAFYEMNPAFGTPEFENFKSAFSNKKLDKLIKVIMDFNKSLPSDSTDPNIFQLGHSYFCDRDLTQDQAIEHIAKFEIIPLISTFFDGLSDRQEIIKLWTQKILAAVK